MARMKRARCDATRRPAGASGGGGLYHTTMDYMRFSQMVLNGGELDGAWPLSPRSIEMMRTNHLSEQALSTMGPGSGFGLARTSSFVGMIQHRGRAVGNVQGQSRNLACQAILESTRRLIGAAIGSGSSTSTAGLWISRLSSAGQAASTAAPTPDHGRPR